MSYLALYRKYRPAKFEDMVGQREVIDVINREIINNKISHAYLFAGPRGTGKTSTAKIMAKMVNCENLSETGVPCNKCNACLNFGSSNDVVEIDAASNNGVDEIRELRDKVNLVPSNCRYKVYIIDEVHMLTTQAFNALLKTLEEPPGHVIFILATTEFFKIPNTVVSRCQKFQFLRVSNDEILKKLKYIAANEKINIEDSTLYEIARLSDGGLRDAINMLDQLSSFSNDCISIGDVYKLSGTFSYDDLYNLLLFINTKDYDKLINFAERINVEGKNISRFIEELLSFLRNVIYYKTTSNYYGIENDNIKMSADLYSIDKFYELIMLINGLLISIKNSSVPYILLGVSLIDISNKLNYEEKPNKKIDFNENIKETVEKTSDENNIIVKTELIKKNIVSEEDRKIRINNTFFSASKEKLIFVKEKWKELDTKILDDKYASAVGLLKDVDIIVSGDNYIMLLAKYDSLVDRLYANIDLVEELLFKTFNINYKVVFLANDEWKYEKQKYIDNLKNGYKYEYINTVDNIKKENVNKEVDDIDKIVDIIGNDIIEYV